MYWVYMSIFHRRATQPSYKRAIYGWILAMSPAMEMASNSIGNVKRRILISCFSLSPASIFVSIHSSMVPSCLSIRSKRLSVCSKRLFISALISLWPWRRASVHLSRSVLEHNSPVPFTFSLYPLQNKSGP